MKKLMKFIAALFTSILMVSNVAVQAVTLEEILEKGELVVGMNAEYPPFEWVQMVDGEPQYYGIDVSLGQLLADELGVELVIDNRAFDALIPSLQTNKIDVIISGMDHTPARAEQVDFSMPYFKEVSQFAVAAGTEGDYASIEDFMDLRIGVLRGSSQEIYMTNTYPEMELVSIAKNGDLMEALKGKKIDAVFMSELTLAQYLLNYSDAVALVDSVKIENEGVGSAVAMTKDNEGLVEAIDEIIAEAIESGKMDEIFEENIQLASENNPAE